MTDASSHPGQEGAALAPVRLSARVQGRVQGVGFRAWARSQAAERGLVGSARNSRDGSVEIVAEGREPDCRALLEALRGSATPGRVDEVTEEWSPAQGDLLGFSEK
jgi:acylphosphatase